MVVHGEETLFRCTDCFETFFISFKLSYHMKSHEEGKFGCKVCSKTFLTQHHLKMHMEVTPYCGTCGSQFRYKKMLETHQKIHLVGEDKNDLRSVSNKLFACGICEQTFETRNS
jgi:hypothetical protein